MVFGNRWICESLCKLVLGKAALTITVAQQPANETHTTID